MKKVFGFIMLLCACAMAIPPVIFTNNNDISTYANFKADSLKYGDVVDITTSTSALMVAMANDTATAGFGSDPVKFDYGYRLGTITINVNGKQDTSWSYRVRCGTFDATTAGNWITSATVVSADSTTGQETISMGKLDSSYVTGYAVGHAPFSIAPKACQLLQPWIKGLTGNSTSNWVKVKTQIIQVLFVPTRQQ